MPAPRSAPSHTRRSPDAARRLILEAAEKRLVEEGPAGVRVQRIARDLGLTDAAIHHHFAGRAGLMEALLRHGGRRLRDEIGELAAGAGEPLDLGRAAELISETFERRGYARLALWLVLSGWRERGAGMFSELVERVHRDRRARAQASGGPPPRLEETRFALALLATALCAEPLMAPSLRRAMGLPGGEREARRYRRWLVRLLEGALY